MEYSKGTREELTKRRVEILKRIDKLKEEAEALGVVLGVVQSDVPEQLTLTEPQIVISPLMILGMKQKPALRLIAKRQNGIIRTGDAKDLMVQARIMKDSKNAYKMVYNLIRGMEDFESTGTRGEYRMKTSRPN
jgi:hypothetical protein